MVSSVPAQEELVDGNVSIVNGNKRKEKKVLFKGASKKLKFRLTIVKGFRLMTR